MELVDERAEDRELDALFELAILETVIHAPTRRLKATCREGYICMNHSNKIMGREEASVLLAAAR